MNRETIIAVSFGIILGVVVGLVVLLKMPGEEKTKVIPVTQQRTGVSLPQKKTAVKDTMLSVSSPSQDLATAEDAVKITGKAPANSLIVVQSAASRVVEKAKTEDFALTLPLALGENNIHLSSYGQSGSPQELDLVVYRIEE